MTKVIQVQEGICDSLVLQFEFESNSWESWLCTCHSAFREEWGKPQILFLFKKKLCLESDDQARRHLFFA